MGFLPRSPHETLSRRLAPLAGGVYDARMWHGAPHPRHIDEGAKEFPAGGGPVHYGMFGSTPGPQNLSRMDTFPRGGGLAAGTKLPQWRAINVA